MKCSYCQRPVLLFNFQRRRLRRKVLPYCGSCHRYALTWAHLVILAMSALAVLAVIWYLVFSG
jgi:hypothetical protein